MTVLKRDIESVLDLVHAIEACVQGEGHGVPDYADWQALKAALLVVKVPDHG
jgi:hypothetical protein